MTNLYPELFFVTNKIRFLPSPIGLIQPTRFSIPAPPYCAMARLCSSAASKIAAVTPIYAPLGRATVSTGGASTQCRH